MSVVTGATSTQDFVNSMQSRDALSRNEANAASSAATSLSTSKNRGERLAAIEKQIAVLKTQADEKAASAQTAAETAQSERDALDKLRQEGEARRNELSSMIDSLDSQSAKQAAQTVLIASQVDSYNRQYQKEQQDAANRVDTGNQGGTPSTPVTPTPAPTPTPPPTPTVPGGGGSSSGGQGTSNGDYGNAYAAGQCTYWAYERRRQMGIGTPVLSRQWRRLVAQRPLVRLARGPQPSGRCGALLPAWSGWCRRYLWPCCRSRSRVWRRHIPDLRNELGWSVEHAPPHLDQFGSVLVRPLTGWFGRYMRLKGSS